ncbi:MAG: hypothetical protein KA313_06865 [Pseudarcicella sp.]|nr:hypothetical protein [Pseudarcicella sp.]
MKIAFIVFEDITWLDFIGIYDPITRLKTSNYLPNLEWQICSFSENAEDLYGLKIAPLKSNPTYQNSMQ